MPSALSNMPSLAAAATACRFSGNGIPSLELNTAKDKLYSVRLHGGLVVIYKLRQLGGSGNPRFIHQEAPQTFHKTFKLRDPPETFFQSYVACRELLHHMIAQMRLLTEFDLAAADNWDDFLPHRLATIIVNKYRNNVEDNMGASLRYDVDVPLTILVTAFYSEPKALLRPCLARLAGQKIGLPRPCLARLAAGPLMMPSALRNMPPLVAAATACRFSGEGSPSLELNPENDKPCSVRLHGDLVVIYKLRELGCSGEPRFIHQEAPQTFSKTFQLRDPPEIFFRSYVACRELLHHMIAQTQLLAEFDLAAADNWDDFLPHHLATTIVNKYRLDVEDNMGFSLHYDVDVPLTIEVRAVYSEPKALLLACKQAATVARCQFMEVAPECCVCMEALPYIDNTAADTVVVLPCSHAFHTCCLELWFRRVSTCPLCRRDMINYLAAVAPRGKFPGLEAWSSNSSPAPDRIIHLTTPLGEGVPY